MVLSGDTFISKFEHTALDLCLLKHKTVLFSPEAVVKSCKTSVTVGLIAPMVVVTEFTKETKKEAIKTPMLTSKTHIYFWW